MYFTTILKEEKGEVAAPGEILFGPGPLPLSLGPDFLLLGALQLGIWSGCSQSEISEEINTTFQCQHS